MKILKRKGESKVSSPPETAGVTNYPGRPLNTRDDVSHVSLTLLQTEKGVFGKGFNLQD